MPPLDVDELPSDIEAERQVIGGMLLSGSSVTEAMTALAPDDFYCKPYRNAFAAICEMVATNQPVNAQTVMRKLSDTKTADGGNILSEMGGGSIVMGSMEGVLPQDTTYWTAVVTKKRGERDLIGFADWARKLAGSAPTDLAAVRAQIEERLSTLQTETTGAASKDVTKMGDDLDALQARFDRYIDDPDAITGIETGWTLFDRYLDGFQPGNVTIIYAPSSRFKSMFATNIGYRLALRGHRGLWYTTEMPKLQVQERIVQLDIAKNFRWLRRDHTIHHYRDEIQRSIEKLRDLPIYISDKSEVDVGAFRAAVTRYKKWHDIKYVIVDLVDMLGTEKYKDDTIAQQSAIMRAMKSIAKNSDVHIILITHVSKGEKSMNKKSSLDVEDMKGSSSKYQDVDCAISLMPVAPNHETGGWRGLLREEIAKRIHEDGQMTVLVVFTKNRHGEIGELPFVISLTNGGRMRPLTRGGTMVQAQLPITAPVLADYESTGVHDEKEVEHDAEVE
jgi:replicative DNA helicase